MIKSTIQSSSDWLTQFSIAISSTVAHIYPNARQQLLIILTINVRAGRTISEEELKSLRVTARVDNDFIVLPEGDNGDLWFYSPSKNEYDNFPGGSGVSTIRGRSDKKQFFEKWFFVSTRATAGTRMTFYAQITRQLESGPVTFNTAIDPTFKGSVDVIAAPVPQFNVPDNYHFDRVLVAGNGNSDLYTFEYLLAGRNMQLPVVTFRSAAMAPAGMIQWVDRTPGETRASHVGYAGPGETSISYNREIALGSQFTPAATVVRPRDGHITVILQGANNVPYDSHSAIHHGGPCYLNAVDMYGNNHLLGVRFQDPTPAGRLVLELF